MSQSFTELLTSPPPPPPPPLDHSGAHFNIFCMDKCMFCMQMPPIHLDFKKPIFVGLGTQEFFQKGLPRCWDLMACKTNSRLVAWGMY